MYERHEAVSFLENGSEKILQQSQSAIEQDFPNTEFLNYLTKPISETFMRLIYLKIQL